MKDELDGDCLSDFYDRDDSLRRRLQQPNLEKFVKLIGKEGGRQWRGRRSS